MEKSTSKQLDLPIIPDDVVVTSGANTIAYNIIKTGEQRMPRGVKATGYSWDGVLPGKSMKGLPFVFSGDSGSYLTPKNIVSQLETWKKKGTELTFVCGSFINVDVFIEDFNQKFFGVGHCKYHIELTVFPKLTVTTSPAPKPKKGEDGGTTTTYKNPKKGKVTGSNVAYRKGPGKNYAKLGTLKKGTEVTIYAVQGNWYKIKNAGSLGAGGFVSGWGVINPQIARVISAGNINIAGLTQDEWWISSSYVKVTSGAPTKHTPSTPRTPKKKHSGGGSKNTPTGGKQKYTPTLPKTGLVNNSKKQVVTKPASQKPGVPRREVQ